MYTLIAFAVAGLIAFALTKIVHQVGWRLGASDAEFMTNMRWQAAAEWMQELYAEARQSWLTVRAQLGEVNATLKAERIENRQVMSTMLDEFDTLYKQFFGTVRRGEQRFKTDLRAINASWAQRLDLARAAHQHTRDLLAQAHYNTTVWREAAVHEAAAATEALQLREARAQVPQTIEAQLPLLTDHELHDLAHIMQREILSRSTFA